MARSKDGAPFSLFAFQDAITSVCGVIVLVTLMLALELARRVLDDGAPPGVSAAAYEEAKEEASALKANIDAVETTLDLSTETFEAVAGLSFDEATKQNATARKRDDAAKETRERLKARREDAKQVEAAANALAGKNAKIEEKISELEEELEEARKAVVPSNDERVYFEYDYSAREKPWFVDIAESRIVVYGDGEPTSYKSSGSFLTWALKRPAATEYFVLIVRPSGAADYEKIAERLKENDRRMGVDLVGETQELALLTTNAPKSASKGEETDE